MKFLIFSSVCIIVLGSAIALNIVSLAKSSLVLLIPAIIVLFYNLPGKKNLRSLPKMKVYLILTCWMIALVYFPLIYFDKLKTYYAILITLHQSIFFIIILILFDIKDVASDSPSLKTIPMRIEINKLKKMLYGLCLLFMSVSIVRFYYLHDLNIFIAQQILFVYLLILINKTNADRDEMFYLFWVEASILIQPLSYFILDKL